MKYQQKRGQILQKSLQIAPKWGKLGQNQPYLAYFKQNPRNSANPQPCGKSQKSLKSGVFQAKSRYFGLIQGYFEQYLARFTGNLSTKIENNYRKIKKNPPKTAKIVDFRPKSSKIHYKWGYFMTRSLPIAQRKIKKLGQIRPFWGDFEHFRAYLRLI